MKYYSTRRSAPEASLADAVIRGLAPDKGLYMPERIVPLPASFYDRMASLSLREIATEVAGAFFGEDVEAEALRTIVRETLAFDIPLVQVDEGLWSLELYHGPTAAFKDVGARFMARLLRYCTSRQGGADGRDVDVLVATSGDTGSAVANGFLGVEGIRVCVLYPKGKVSEIQEKQFTTLGRNITALEVDGTFDDCQRLVKEAFMDATLGERLRLTSANSINVARFLPQAFYYFHAVAQLQAAGERRPPVVGVPSGNFGNLTAGLFAARMGLGVARWVAANNRNDIFLQYLRTAQYAPRPSVQTIANAMDVGDPSNFARILDLYGHSHEAIVRDIGGASYTDAEIRAAMRECLDSRGYLLDPHGACAYRALRDGLRPGETGIMLETAHPAKFRDVVEEATGASVTIPATLQRFMDGRKQAVPMTARFEDFRDFLLQRN